MNKIKVCNYVVADRDNFIEDIEYCQQAVIELLSNNSDQELEQNIYLYKKNNENMKTLLDNIDSEGDINYLAVKNFNSSGESLVEKKKLIKELKKRNIGIIYGEEKMVIKPKKMPFLLNALSLLDDVAEQNNMLLNQVEQYEGKINHVEQDYNILEERFECLSNSYKELKHDVVKELYFVLENFKNIGEDIDII